jgi:hypothetical protein
VRQALLDPLGHREAVQDHVDPGRQLGQHRQRVVLRRACVDDERLADRPRQLDLRSERPLLVRLRRVVAVVIEAGLADGHALRVRGERRELGQIGVVEPGGRVRMTPDGRIHLREGLGRRQRRPARRAVGPDGDDPIHPSLDGHGHQLGIRRLAQVQVRVGIDHRFGNSGSSARTGSPLPRSPNSARS